MPRELITYRRADLYAEVWADPVRTVAKRHGISDVALAKICRRLNVPVPGLGYWARKAAGQEVEQLPLPPASESAPDEVTINRWAPDEPSGRKLPALAKPARRGAALEPAIIVPETLDRPHKLVAEAKRLLSRRKPDDHGLVRCWSERCLDVYVSPEQLDRALRIMHGLIYACERGGLQVAVTDPKQPEAPWEFSVPYNQTRALVEGEWVQVALRERYRIERNEQPKHRNDREGILWRVANNRTRHVPSGVLEFRLGGSHSSPWHDTKRRPLEVCLDQVIGELHVIAERIKFRRANALAEEKRRAEEERLRMQAEARAQEARKRNETYLRMLQSWQLARDVREFAADAMGIVTDSHCKIVPDDWLDQLLKWADGYAAQVDPFTPLRDQVTRHIAERPGTEM